MISEGGQDTSLDQGQEKQGGRTMARKHSPGHWWEMGGVAVSEPDY